jgi:hypothetical protein
MEKREGNPLHEVPGSDTRLTDEQLAAYNAAFQTIEGDLSTMRPAREALSRLELSPSGTKPARGERFKTGHSEARDSYHFWFFNQGIFAAS